MDRNFLNRRKNLLKSEDQRLKEEEERLKKESENSGGSDNSEDNSEDNSSNEESEKDESQEESEDNENEDKEETEDEEDSEEEEDDDEKSEDEEDEKSKDDDSKDKKEESPTDDKESRKKLSKRNEDTEGSKPGTDKIKEKAMDKVNEKLGENEAVSKAIKMKQMASKAAAAVKSLTSVGGVLVKILINPIFWAVVVALLIVAALSATTSIMGGNDYNQSCDISGVGGVSVAEDADDFTRQSAIASWLMSTPFKINGDQPLSKEQAAGIVGNFMQESYQANPKTIQGDSSMTEWQSCDNNCVLSWGSSGKAIGIAQWMGGRRMNLAKFAAAEGTQWHDLTTQLKFLKQEMDSGYEYDQLVKGGFGDIGQSTEDYAWLWQKYFERAGESRGGEINQKRETYAKDFYAKYAGGGSMGSVSTNCVTSGPINSSDLVQLALQISFSREEKAAGLGYGVCPTLPGCGDSFSKPEYISAKQMAEAVNGADPMPGLTASCDRMAATLYRLTGVDPNFPWGGATIQLNYARNSPNWAKVSCQERQPGDALIRPGHIMVYIGMIDGRDTIASASIALASRVGPNGKGRAAHLSDVSCRGDLFYADGDVTEGFRKVN